MSGKQPRGVGYRPLEVIGTPRQGSKYGQHLHTQAFGFLLSWKMSTSQKFQEDFP